MAAKRTTVELDDSFGTYKRNTAFDNRTLSSNAAPENRQLSKDLATFARRNKKAEVGALSITLHGLPTC